MHPISPKLHAFQHFSLKGQPFLPALVHLFGILVHARHFYKGHLMTRFRDHELKIKLLLIFVLNIF